MPFFASFSPCALTVFRRIFCAISSAQSKWVTEKLCQIAARTTPIHTAVLRTSHKDRKGVVSWVVCFTGIGQMVGDTTNGIWNESEGISLIFKVSRSLVSPASLALTRDASVQTRSASFPNSTNESRGSPPTTPPRASSSSSTCPQPPIAPSTTSSTQRASPGPPSSPPSVPPVFASKPSHGTTGSKPSAQATPTNVATRVASCWRFTRTSTVLRKRARGRSCVWRRRWRRVGG